MLTTPSVLTLSVTPRHTTIGLNSHLTSDQVCATLKACNLDDGDTRAPVDVIVALDVSGSMEGQKLFLCQMTLQLLLRQLTPDDRFGLVSFSDDAIIEIPIRKVTTINRKLADETIQQLGTRGMTNLSAAIGLAAQEMIAVESPNEVRSILLLTDGLTNQGITSSLDIVELTKNCLSLIDQAPITMFCFGYGSDHNEILLQEMSAASPGGTYYYVEDVKQVATAFGDALGGILSVVAQSAILNISVPDEAKARGVDIIDVYYKNKVKTNDGWKVSLADFYAEESRDVLFSVKLADQSISEYPHVNVFVSYTNTIQKSLEISKVCSCVIHRPQGQEMSTPNLDVEVQWLRVYATDEMDKASTLAQEGDYMAAQVTIINCQSTIMDHKSAALASPLMTQILSDLKLVARGFENQEMYQASGKMNVTRMVQSHGMQRCTEGSATLENSYRSTKKKSMQEKFK